MGKLHKIRKAIEKHPSHFINGWLPGDRYAQSVDISGKDVLPVRVAWSHRRYVRKVLRQLGYDVK